MNNLNKRIEELEQPLLEKDVGEKINELSKFVGEMNWKEFDRLCKLLEVSQSEKKFKKLYNSFQVEKNKSELKGIRFAQQEILKIIDAFQSKKKQVTDKILILSEMKEELKKQIKGKKYYKYRLKEGKKEEKIKLINNRT